MEQAVIALLTARNQEEAAATVGISVKMLQRWQKEPEFAEALSKARMAAFRQSMARLQQASVPAVTTLLKLMIDAGSPATVKARCAYYILDQTRNCIDVEDLETRLTHSDSCEPEESYNDHAERGYEAICSMRRVDRLFR